MLRIFQPSVTICLIFAVSYLFGDSLGKMTKRWIGKNECSKKLQQRRLEYLFNYFIVFIMKAHDERENCYL